MLAREIWRATVKICFFAELLRNGATSFIWVLYLKVREYLKIMSTEFGGSFLWNCVQMHYTKCIYIRLAMDIKNTLPACSIYWNNKPYFWVGVCLWLKASLGAKTVQMTIVWLAWGNTTTSHLNIFAPELVFKLRQTATGKWAVDGFHCVQHVVVVSRMLLMGHKCSLGLKTCQRVCIGNSVIFQNCFT